MLVIGAIALAPAMSAQPRTSEQPVRRSAGRLMLGESYIVMNGRSDNRVEIGAGMGDTVLVLVLEEVAVTRWADSTAKLLATTRRPRKGRTFSYRSSVEEPGTTAGGMSFTRRITGRESEYHLFFADHSYGGFNLPVTRAESLLLVKTARSAVRLTRELSRMTGETVPDRSPPRRN